MTNQSTVTVRTLAKMPHPVSLQRTFQANSMAEAMTCENEFVRYFRFRTDWTSGAMLGMVDNGSGEYLRAAFTGPEAILRGFDRASPIAEDSTGAIDEEILASGSRVPVALQRIYVHEDFRYLGSTYCLWYELDGTWNSATAMSASPEVVGFPLVFLDLLIGGPSLFVRWLREYYELDFDVSIMTSLMNGVPLSSLPASAVTCNVRDRLNREARLIGYPI